jgi:hypothetical protein
MNGWKYDWVDELPRPVYAVLIDWLTAPHPPAPEDE